MERLSNRPRVSPPTQAAIFFACLAVTTTVVAVLVAVGILDATKWVIIPLVLGAGGGVWLTVEAIKFPRAGK